MLLRGLRRIVTGLPLQQTASCEYLALYLTVNGVPITRWLIASNKPVSQSGPLLISLRAVDTKCYTGQLFRDLFLRFE